MANSPPGTSDEDSPDSNPFDPIRHPEAQKVLSSYWRSNVKVLVVLMTLWAIVGLGCGILWADWLNQFRFGGYQLGFWFAQQGSIISFLLIILVYCVIMNWLDAKHHRELEALGVVKRQAKPAGNSQRSGGGH